MKVRMSHSIGDKDVYHTCTCICVNSLVVVEVDLTAAHFQPGKPNYERVKWSLEERLGEDIRFVLCHSLTGISTINVVGLWCKP